MRYAPRVLRQSVLIAFSRGDVSSFITIDDVRCALVEFPRVPALTIPRDQMLPAAKLAELRKRYVICFGSLPLTTTVNGVEYYTIVDPIIGAEVAA